mmetsp:Transcript_7116/g.13467  ORF Transcript_7116/g.13467 Transcript_7116/m.13467 type:complete len:443 (-) Transcript_7116:286-1614(-)|eukprot:CAMPEP_0175159796 /NCGR_PEP_ID=MMETSP0087-20121206/23628_1 /TAXON_ID=136419 /ORGANISM="Unknown Unknown, Strain D1" /LENGTH=442 /DNA_ID=CAMNT_0016447899 /DNA_START=47 /DNA_END=1375 /DNA_ORIENTATION=-
MATEVVMQEAQAEPSSKKAYPAEIYFENTQNVVFGFQELQECLDVESNVREEIKRLEAHFSQLKMDYLFLETKQGVLEAVSRTDYKTVIDEHQDVAEFRKRSSDGKNKLFAVKQEIRSLKKQLRELIPELSAKWEAYRANHDSFASSYDKENDRANVDEHSNQQARNETTRAFGKSLVDDLQMDSSAKCHTVLANQQKSKGSVLQEQEELNTKLTDLTGRLTPLMENVEKMEKEYAEIVIKLAAQEDQKVGFPFQAQVDWYQGAMSVLKALNGFEVEMTSPNSITFTFAQAKMLVTYTADGSKFEKVELDSPADVTDIVEHAIATQDLPLLVTEVQQRLARAQTREANLQAVFQAWPNTTWEAPILRAALTSLSTGDIVQVALRISPEYPAPHAVISCQSVQVISGAHDQVKLEALMGMTNQSCGSPNLADFLTTLQNTCFC